MTPPKRRSTNAIGATARLPAASGRSRPKQRATTNVVGSDPLKPITNALTAGADLLHIPDGAAIVLAVSGGPDSTALLHGSAALAAGRGWRLTVAHLDHGLRETSAAEAAGVASIATALGLPAEVRRVDVATLAAAEHRSVEDAGRQAREASPRVESGAVEAGGLRFPGQLCPSRSTDGTPHGGEAGRAHGE